MDVLLSQGKSVGEAVRTIGVTQFTYYRWRKEFGGLKGDQVKRLKELEKENDRLRKAASDRDCRIFCARGLFSSLGDEPFAEDDGELSFCLEPLARRPFPVLGSVVENQI